MGMGINHREWERMGLKKIFPLMSNVNQQIHLNSLDSYSTLIAARASLFITDDVVSEQSDLAAMKEIYSEVSYDSV